MSENKKLRVAFLWHMHQPFYLEPENNKFVMPWVRFHALKDYLDMPLTAAKYNIKATFNLVPSLLDQIELYCQGCTDRHQDLSRIPATSLSLTEKEEILELFFEAHYPTMIEPFTRYRQLFRKKESCGKDVKLAADIFSTSEIRDLQVWSNLVWIDPMFRSDTLIKELFNKGRDFTESEKTALLDYQVDLMKKIIPTYQELYNSGKIDISFTPYYHPILPLLIDTDSAREAITDIKLPRNRFQHPEDADWHIKKSAEKFKSIFGEELKGMWPSEGSVSEETLKLISKNGIKWIASDEQILRQSLIKSGKSQHDFSPHYAYSFDSAPEMKLFFRDHGLSDKIGFVYSSWHAERAVNDFIQNLKNIGVVLENSVNDCVIPIILDGENAWEYFPDDGTEFLNRMYQTLAEDDEIEVISFDDAASFLQPIRLAHLFSGSWINHNFRIWIGHSEDNAAWDLLYNARKDLVEYESKHPEVDKKLIEKAWKQIYIAEGSDWCWWYGDDHIGAHNKEFDELFRHHLGSMYRILKLDIPAEIIKPIHRGRIESFVTYPETLITPQIDGLLTHYYEWSGSGVYDCDKAGGAMHRVDIVVKAIYFAYDYDNIYIKLDFKKNIDLVGKGVLWITLDFEGVARKKFKLTEEVKEEKNLVYAFKRDFEIGVSRKLLCKDGNGVVRFYVMLYSESNLIEKWPLDEPITLELPEKDKEIFWQV
jgi:alpha-amylase/alpha-mannosidase (GH57 family)